MAKERSIESRDKENKIGDNGKGKKHRRQDKEKKIEDEGKGRSIEGRTKKRR